MQLGIWIDIRPERDVPRLFEQVAELGFGAVQAHFPAGCDAALVRRVRRAAAASGIEIVAVSGYANPLRPADAPMGFTQAALADLIALLPEIDSRRVVTWSGTYAANLLEEHPDNQSASAWDALRRAVDDLFPLLDASDAILVFEPFFTHVLDTPERIVAFCEEVGSPYVRVVLDPPNLLTPGMWQQQSELLPPLVAALALYTSLAHLKDMRLRGAALDLPGPGEGVLDYPAFLGALARAEISAPLVIEHVALERAARARRFVLEQLRLARGQPVSPVPHLPYPTR